MTYRADYLIAPPATPVFAGPEAVQGEFWIYYHLDADSMVLYIGKTSKPSARTKQHETGSPWFSDVASTVWFGPLDEVNAAAVERELIGVEQPPNNFRHTERGLTPQARMDQAAKKVERLRTELSIAENYFERCRDSVIRQNVRSAVVADGRNTQK